MHEEPIVDDRGEPIKDPVDKFMRQLAESAARYRRAMTGAPPVIVENASAAAHKMAAPELDLWKAQQRLAPAIESVSVAEAEEVPGCWVVDARDSENALLRAVFDGPDAEQRAHEYARWKYGGEG